jgi:hypothetical protein
MKATTVLLPDLVEAGAVLLPDPVVEGKGERAATDAGASRAGCFQGARSKRCGGEGK